MMCQLSNEVCGDAVAAVAIALADAIQQGAVDGRAAAVAARQLETLWYRGYRGTNHAAAEAWPVLHRAGAAQWRTTVRRYRTERYAMLAHRVARKTVNGWPRLAAIVTLLGPVDHGCPWSLTVEGYGPDVTAVWSAVDAALQKEDERQQAKVRRALLVDGEHIADYDCHMQAVAAAVDLLQSRGEDITEARWMAIRDGHDPRVVIRPVR